MNTLKKGFVLVAVGLLAFSSANAQWYAGPRLGLNYAKMSFNNGGENRFALGFHGGATGRFQFTKQFSAQADLLASIMGNTNVVETTAAGTTTTIETTTSPFYVQLPLYINFEKPIKSKQLVPYRVKESVVSFHLYGGGYFGYALSSAQSTTTTINDGTTKTTTTVSGNLESSTYNPIDFGVMLGTGFSFKLDEHNKNRFYVDLRYLMGFSDYDKSKTGTASNSAAQISFMFSRKITQRIYTNRHRF
ncbi:MAG: PorT family protein [Flavobacteriales bacterium]|nr:PorT family protein [Flavobacteriales bacterium]